jgi:hypothetical protein
MNKIMRSFFRALKNIKTSQHVKCFWLFGVALFCHTAINATVYTVNSTSDANSGSGTTGTLRYCITQANASSAGLPHAINFAIPGTGVQVINVASIITITQPMKINGYSQPGSLPLNGLGAIADRDLKIQLVPAIGVANTLEIQTSNVEISGLVIVTYLSTATGGSGGIFTNANNTSVKDNEWIWGCNFGTTPSGTATAANQGGLSLAIYGNTSGSGTTRAVGVSNMQNWIIGTNSDGINDSNEGNIFSQGDPANSFGTTPYELARFYNCDNFIIAGNYFGLQKDGLTALQTFNPNGPYHWYGIALPNSSGFRIGTDGNGSNDAGERNIFAGMRGAAIGIPGNAPSGTTYNGDANYAGRNTVNHLIAGNYFGTNTTGTATDSNLRNFSGVLIWMTHNITLGGNTPVMRNVIVNSTVYGVNVKGDKYSGNILPAKNILITGNYIGVLADGTTALPNNVGVALNANIQGTVNAMVAADTSVYKTTISNNVIAYNTGGGIQVRPVAVNGRVFDNTITQNTLYSNTGLGINLGSSDADLLVTGNNGLWSNPATSAIANRLMNYGIVKTATLLGDSLTISGFIGNIPAGNTDFAGATVEFFSADNSPADQDGQRFTGDGLNMAHGEGKTYLGLLTADANGKFSGTIDVFGKGVTATTLITNTATSTTGSTSEFGVNIVPITVAGNVYDDGNGLKNSKVDGAGTNAGGLNAILYDNSLGMVVGINPVSTGGTYSFPGAITNSNYSVYVTKSPAVIDQVAKPTVAFPSGWVTVGEVNCGKTAGCIGSDGTPDGILNLGVLTDSVMQANFGIDSIPVAANYSVALAHQPAGGASIKLDGSANGSVLTGEMPPPPGADHEDGNLGVNVVASGVTIAIDSIPANATLKYNGAAVTAGAVFVNYNPSLLTIQLTTVGSLGTAFKFHFKDKADISSIAATYTISWPTALPLNLLSFDAQKTGNTAVLHWCTAAEVNTRSFSVERSCNGQDFTGIGTVAAVNGDGNHSYAFTDVQPSSGVAIYRLRMIDNNNADTYSPARYLEFTSATAITIVPNPASYVLHISNAPAGALMRLLNMEGQIVLQQEIGSASETVDIARCAPGTYILQIIPREGPATATRIIKQ